jgi:hypothetical protein
MVAPVEGTNLRPSQIDVISQTMTAAYQAAQTDAVIPLVTTRQAIEQNGSVQNAAQKLGASEYIYATAVRFETHILITATRYTSDGTVIYTSKMKAASLDDVDMTAERLAKGLVTKKAVAETRTIESVTVSESKAPNQTWSNKVPGFKAGLVYPIGWGKTIEPMMTAGFEFRLEGKDKFLEFGVGLTIPPGNTDGLSYGGVYSEIGLNYYLSENSTAPYLGFGVMPRLMSMQVTNLAPYLQGGVMFFRESRTRAYLDLRVAQNVLPVGFGSTYSYDSNTGNSTSSGKQDLYPAEVSLQFGIGL